MTQPIGFLPSTATSFDPDVFGTSQTGVVRGPDVMGMASALMNAVFWAQRSQRSRVIAQQGQGPILEQVEAALPGIREAALEASLPPLPGDPTDLSQLPPTFPAHEAIPPIARRLPPSVQQKLLDLWARGPWRFFMGFGQFVSGILSDLTKIATTPIPQGSILARALPPLPVPIVNAMPVSSNFGQSFIPDVQRAGVASLVPQIARQLPGIAGGLLLGEGLEGFLGMGGGGGGSSAAFHTTPAGNVVANNVRDEINPGTGKRSYWIRARPSSWTGPISVTKKRHHHHPPAHHHPR